MKKYLILILIAVLLITVGFSGCLSRQLIKAEKLDEEPNDYVNMTEELMEEFPHVKEAVLNQSTYIDTPYTEFSKFFNFLKKEDTEFIKYQNEYYKIWFASED